MLGCEYSKAPQEQPLPGTRPTATKEVTVDTTTIRESTQKLATDELLAAACEAMRLLQDRQAHTPIEMLDPRERKVLRSFRQAVRRAVAEK
jgi:hypothetical protein